MTAELATKPLAGRHALEPSLVLAAVSELVATSFLLIAIVGSGIMAERLSAAGRRSVRRSVIIL